VRYSHVIMSFVICSVHANQKKEIERSKQIIDRIKEVSVGMFAGVAQVVVDQPLLYKKNATQLHASMEKKRVYQMVRMLYKGGLINASTLGIITAVQLAVAGGMRNSLFSDPNSAWAHISATYVGGFVSGVLSGPAEYMILHKQNFNKTDFSFATALKSSHHGMLAACLRDGGFAAFCFGLTSVIKVHMTTRDQEVVKGVYAGSIAGVLSTGVTHPFDTIKTHLQNEGHLRTKKSTWAKGVELYKRGGIQELYKGCVWRGMRVISGTIIMSIIYDMSKKYAYIS